jgi:hypothetical protein
VVINSKPVLSAGSNSPVCAGNTLNLTATAGMSTYAWTYPNGSSSSVQNPSIANAPLTAQGTYALTATNTNGCSATASTAVTVNPSTNPVINISSNSPVCDGGTLSFTVTPQITGSYLSEF